MCEISSPIVSFSPINTPFKNLKPKLKTNLVTVGITADNMQSRQCHVIKQSCSSHTSYIASWLMAPWKWCCNNFNNTMKLHNFIKVSQQPDIKTLGMLNFLIRTGRTGRLSGREVLPDFGIRTRVYFHLNRPHYILPNTQLNGYINYFFVFVKWTQQ